MIHLDPQRFLEALYQLSPGEVMPPGFYGYVCEFTGIGNPFWKGRPWQGGSPLEKHEHNQWRGSWDEKNVYAVVSIFQNHGIPADAHWRRRKDNFAALMAVMLDDLGTKVPMDRGLLLPPSYLVETSPGNFQSWLFLNPPEYDRDRAEGLLDALVRSGLSVDGKDPGMKGVTRYGRPPFGHNDKPKYVEALGHPFKVRCVEWHPERRYRVEDIVQGYGLTLTPPRKAYAGPPPSQGVQDAASKEFDVILRCLHALGLYKKGRRDGWHEITCPWVDEHTDGKDDGAAVSAPCEANGYRGGFRCHHGSHEDRGMKHLRSEIQERLLAKVATAVKPAKAKSRKAGAK
jgi:hypothetical protein